MAKETVRHRLAIAIARAIGGPALAARLSTVTVQVDDAPAGAGVTGWFGFQGGPNDRDASEIQQQYTDALTAWRKNPMAKRIIDCIVDYTLGDGMTPTATGQLGQFIRTWWEHPKNHMELRLPELCEELARAGDLFLSLHTNPVDGVSYVRPIPKDRIVKIETAPNDWETELALYEAQGVGEPRQWLAPDHPGAAEAPAVMLHYSVNRVVGALMGESDLATMIPWLLRYSRLLEDRVRLHWAARAFLWVVTVPSNLVAAKQDQYRAAPDSGSIIVKDDAESWDAVSPDLKGFDAQFDLRAIRQMIDAGSGLPPHWRGEGHDVSLATAQAMEHAASRHLRRRQLYTRYIVQDLAHNAYTRAALLAKVRAKPNRSAIAITMTDLDRADNRDLASAAQTIAQALDIAARTTATAKSNTLRRLALRLILRFGGEHLDNETIDAIFAEAGPYESPSPNLPAGQAGDGDGGEGDQDAARSKDKRDDKDEDS
jgi:hypothetical protein